MRSFLFFVLFCIGYKSSAQTYSSLNYTTKDGLAGNTVYSMCRDKDGFMWFATENGVSRFDGTNFKNFTASEGLPDNEIIYLYCDIKGRVWMAPFKKSICYYYKGKIYNQENDDILKKLTIKGVITRICDDKDGNVVLMARNQLVVIETNNKISTYSKLIDNKMPEFTAVGQKNEEGFWVLNRRDLYSYVTGVGFRKVNSYPDAAFGIGEDFINGSRLIYHNAFVEKYLVSVNLITARKDTLSLPYQNTLRIQAHADSFLYLCTLNGVYECSSSKNVDIRHYFPGISISGFCKDAENNTWFSSLGNGVFRLNSENIKNYRSVSNSGKRLAVSAFFTDKSDEVQVLYRDGYKSGFSEKENKLQKPVDLIPLTLKRGNQLFFCYLPLIKNRALVGLSGFLAVVEINSGNYLFSKYGFSFKDIYRVNNEDYIVGSNSSAVLFSVEKMQFTDTFMQERATSVFYESDTAYVGTLDGLVIIPPDKKPIYAAQKNKLLSSRIIRIRRAANGVLWLATHNNGLIGFKSGKVTGTLNQTNGLSSNICHDLFVDGNTLWLATAKGVCKIDVSSQPIQLANYGVSDGLSSDNIKTVYVKSGKVYAGSDEGVDVFEEKVLKQTSICKLVPDDIVVSGISKGADADKFTLKQSQNNILFYYSTISYKSGREIKYYYRLSGLDTAWQTTSATTLSYPSLPPGNYKLELYSVNKYGVKSDVLTRSFIIEKKFFQKLWVQLLFLFTATAIIWFFLSRRYKNIRKKEEEQSKLVAAITNLEQMAFKAQMNPHFIFNCLNSIQQYVIEKDVAGANYFISSFSRLIRQTLDFSARNEISLQEEIQYLTDYLKLEESRLENKFSFSIAADKDISTSEILFPPLLLQPFAENAVRHGVRHLSDNSGVIEISFSKKENELICIISDNGIGRMASLNKKTENVIEYQSRGMEITMKRIHALNKKNKQNISATVEDLYDATGKAAGTKVKVTLPINQ
ncbi:MAG: histidine kinase [Chitinophagaceae bacterium]|nr:histidine kinase [Chitinophagaceae bacterium]